MSPSPEKRHFRRIPIAYQVKLVSDDRIIAYPSAIDLSMGGILLGAPRCLPVGSQCGVAIILEDGPNGRRVVARGDVVRVDSRGMAIAFSKALDANSEAALRLLIHSLEPGAEEAVEPAPEALAPLESEDPEPAPQDPQSSLARLMDRLKPGSARALPGPAAEGWQPPFFERYEDIRTWMKESVMSANLYERFPDGRWTIELLLKEQDPGTTRYIVL